MNEFTLPDMSCGHCAGRVTKALKDADPACTLEFDVPAKKVRVNSSMARAALTEHLTEAGYPPA